MYSSTISIIVLNSTGSATTQQLILSGPGLPLMGAEWGMKNQLVTTWYPGNSEEATQQMLVSEETPSRWHGEWHVTQLYAVPQSYSDATGAQYTIIDPLSLWNAMEEIARSGQRVRVIWSVTTDDGNPSSQGTVIREGRFADLKFKPQRVQDIEWEASFDWVSRGDTTARVTSTRSNTVAQDSASYQNALQTLIDLNQQAALGLLTPTYFDLGINESFGLPSLSLQADLSVTVSDASDDVEQAVTLSATLSSQPVSVSNQAIDFAQDSIVQSNSFYDTLSQQPYELYTQDPYTLASFMAAFNFFAPQSDAAQQLAQVAQLFTAQLRTQVQNYLNSGTVAPTQLGDPNAILCVYTTVAGDTPQAISARMYGGSPDHAVDVLRANGLSWHTPSFVAGRQLIIPRLSSVNATQAI